MVKILSRAILLIVLPFFMAWTVLRRVAIELKSIPFYVWCDLREDWDDFCHFWRTGGIN